MLNTKTYSLLNVKFLFISFVVLVTIFSLSFSIFGAIKILSDFGENAKITITGIFALALNSYLLYFLGRIIVLYVKYTWHDLNTNIKIDFESETLTIHKSLNYYVLNSKNIDLIEFHLSASDYRSFMRYFEYTKLVFLDGKELVITNFILNYSIIENMFDNVKKTKKIHNIIFLP